MGKVEPVNDEQRAARPGIQALDPERVAGRHHRGQQLAILIVKDEGRNGTCARVISWDVTFTLARAVHTCTYFTRYVHL